MDPKPRVLCVDDEPQVLEGLTLSLRRGFQVIAVNGGEAGLETLGRETGIAVIVSDMRMPGMDGATFLSKARQAAPDVTRMLLTGHADADAAIAAVNEGRIFRFLTKPCSPPTLVAAVSAAVEQHRLVTAERELLQQTLRGCIQMLMDVLALAAPIAFGHATRIKRSASELAAKVPGAEVWSIEVAALLSRIGAISLAPAVLEKMDSGKPLSADEEQAVDRLPAVAEQLIANIPRLDEVRAVLKHLTRNFEAAGAARGKEIPLGARVLRIVSDFDRLEASGLSRSLALDTMRGRRGCYDTELLEVFAALAGNGEKDVEVLEIPARMVRVGMTFLSDVRTNAGTLLVARGQESTTGLVERFRNYPQGSIHEPLRVALRRTSLRG
jgi:response regulator RpfG family c-di-GMP phosphodiesterase